MARDPVITFADRLEKLVETPPEGVSIGLVDACENGVMLSVHGEESPAAKRYIASLKRVLKSVPDGYWLRGERDEGGSIQIGEGVVTIVSTSSYGTGGACSAHYDDLSQHVVASVCVPLCPVDDPEDEIARLTIGGCPTELIIK
jgi:hypothetical protein